ncbi:ABC transporter ATP-binding protein [Rufibacter sp. LB8]|uniref:ABC transporter ATP-binding protein n=1 Tax=Rufibacter sp. LB8 TaxID=2777781 RepID=UPI00178C4E55|nr:ABC transporter ATP-binding protein [Rufibacter sp. LB8]
MVSPNPLLAVDHLEIEFQTAQGVVKAVDNVSFHLQKGETVAIVGESGSGKTVLALALLQLIFSSKVKIGNGKALFHSPDVGLVNLLTLPQQQMQKIRGNDISIIFQEPMSSLNPVMTCGKQVREVLLMHRLISKKAANARVLALFEMVQLPSPEKIFKSYPHELSGGQQQRVMIAMAMACEPMLLIADEPTTALDVTVQANILQLLNQLRLEKGTSLLFISHDLGVVAEIADRILVMHQGKIVEQGTTAQIFSNPQHPYTKALLACRPTLTTQKTELPTVADFLKQGPKEESRFSENRESPVEKQQLQDIAKQNPQTISDPEKPLLVVEDVHVQYTVTKGLLFPKKEEISAVNGVSFQVFPGETIAIVGESGSGKTTLAKALLQLVKPMQGTIVFNNQNWATLPSEELRRARKDLQMVFQDPFGSLNPNMKIGHTIMEPMQVHKVFKSRQARKQRALQLLETVGLQPHHFQRYPQEFSGGQQQRISIARALASNPTCIICDEAVSALDVSVQAQVLNLLNQLKRQFNLTILFITHDLAVAKFMADRVLVMHEGKIVEEGTSEEIYERPQHAYTKALLQAVPSGELADILAAQEKRKVYKSSIDE